MLRGSARSIPGLHIRDALAELDARHPGLIPRIRRSCHGGRAEPARGGFREVLGTFRRGGRASASHRNRCDRYCTATANSRRRISTSAWPGSCAARGRGARGFRRRCSTTYSNARAGGASARSSAICGWTCAILATAACTPPSDSTPTTQPPDGATLRVAYELALDEWRGTRAPGPAGAPPATGMTCAAASTSPVWRTLAASQLGNRHVRRLAPPSDPVRRCLVRLRRVRRAFARRRAVEAGRPAQFVSPERAADLARWQHIAVIVGTPDWKSDKSGRKST